MLAGEQVAAPDHQRQLGELAGLQAERTAELDPVPLAGDLDADDEHQRRGATKAPTNRIHARSAPELHRHARGEDHGDDAEHGEQHLALPQRVRRAEHLVALDARRGQHHDQAEDQQEQGGAEQQVVGASGWLSSVSAGRPVAAPRRRVASAGSSGSCARPPAAPKPGSCGDGLGERRRDGRSRGTCPTTRSRARAGRCRRAAQGVAALRTTSIHGSSVAGCRPRSRGHRARVARVPRAMTSRSTPSSTTPRSRPRGCVRRGRRTPGPWPCRRRSTRSARRPQRGLRRVRVGGLRVVDVARRRRPCRRRRCGAPPARRRAAPRGPPRRARRTRAPAPRRRARWRRCAARTDARRAPAPSSCADLGAVLDERAVDEEVVDDAEHRQPRHAQREADRAAALDDVGLLDHRAVSTSSATL